MTKVELSYRCRQCGNLVTVRHDSPSPTLALAMEAVRMLAKIPGAALVEQHECSPGVVGMMDLMGGEMAETPAPPVMN